MGSDLLRKFGETERIGLKFRQLLQQNTKSGPKPKKEDKTIEDTVSEGEPREERKSGVSFLQYSWKQEVQVQNTEQIILSLSHKSGDQKK